jgi:hypothetical protein
MCCTLWLSTPVPPKGVLEYPWSTPWVPTQGKHMGDVATWRSSTVRFGLRDLVAYSSDAI